MAKKIEDLYQSHMQKSSPDMDMLWARIDKRIDAEQDKQKEITQTQNENNITVKHSGFIKYIAAAACLIAVVAGTVLFMNSKENKVSMDESKDDLKPAISNATYDKTLKGSFPSGAKDEKALESETADTIDSAPAEGTKTAGDAATPTDKLHDIMATDEYSAADIDKKIQMLTEIAEKMKTNGEISDYKAVKNVKASRFQITLPDGSIKGFFL